MKPTNINLETSTSSNVPSGEYKTMGPENTYTPSLPTRTEYKDKPNPTPSKITLKTSLESMPATVKVEINVAELERRAAIAALNRKQSSGNR